MLKLRVIAYRTEGKPIMGFTVPDDVALFFEESYFSISKSGGCIVFASGAYNPNPDMKGYNFEDCRIGSVR